MQFLFLDIFIFTSGRRLRFEYYDYVVVNHRRLLLFMIRPQAKRQREQRGFSESLVKGTEVVTASGMLGRINRIEGDIVTLEISPKTFIRITKSAISKELTESVYATMAKNKKAEDAIAAPTPKPENQDTTAGG